MLFLFRGGGSIRQVPFPIQNLRQVLADLVDVLLVLHQLVVHLLDQVSAAVAELRQVLDGVLDQVEAISFCTRMSNGVVMVPSSW